MIYKAPGPRGKIQKAELFLHDKLSLTDNKIINKLDN